MRREAVKRQSASPNKVTMFFIGRKEATLPISIGAWHGPRLGCASLILGTGIMIKTNNAFKSFPQIQFVIQGFPFLRS